MSQPGEASLLVASRRALLDALEALTQHHSALVLIGAQAIYLHTGRASVALAESTKDSDLAIHTEHLRDDPLLEDAMRGAGFTHDSTAAQPGSWLSPDGIPVDLMVPERLAGPGSRRSGDAHDIYRLLVAIDTHSLAQTLGNLRAHHFCGPVTQEALTLLSQLFAAGPHAPGSQMAGRAEELVGDPAVVSASAALLANDLLAQLA